MDASYTTALTAEAWITLGVIAGIFVTLLSTRTAPDVVFFAGAGLLLLLGVSTPEQALSGFSNPGVITIALLYVVMSGLHRTGALDWIVHHVLGRPRTERASRLRVMLPVTGLSAFLNNTPVVALFIPVVCDWARHIRVPASRLLIPLSYASIFGGICTLIGTSTNLVVNGMLQQETGGAGLGMFEIAAVGLPCAVAGTLYLTLFGDRLLPNRADSGSVFEDPREYTVEMIVPTGSRLAGKSVEEAGLRHLPGGFLAELIRGDQVRSGIGPDEGLLEGDRLVFVGIVDSILDLRKSRGLEPAPETQFALDTPHWDRILIEAVVSSSSSASGRTIRDSDFRRRYNAVVLAVSRNGKRVEDKIGDIRLRPGDTLLLEAHRAFVHQQRNSRDFYLVSEVHGSDLLRTGRAPLALIIMGLMVAAVALNVFTMLEGALAAAGAMLVSGCTTVRRLREHIDWPVLILLASALGIGRTFEQTGAAQVVADLFLQLSHHPWAVLLMVYLLTSLCTELITNAVAAVLVFPVAFDAAETLEVNPMPFVIAVMVAASASFSTPVGYQTNLMVYGPGGYRFSDYFRAGIGLNLLFAVLTVGLAPWIWGWTP